MTPAGLAFIGLTAIVAALIAALTFAVLRIFAAARDARLHLREHRGGEESLMAAALADAVTKLKAQERAMTLRAEASERLSEEIIASLSAGLLVVDLSGEVRIVNPAGRGLLGIDRGSYAGMHYRDLLAGAEPVAALVGDCLASGTAFVRRSVEIPASPGDATHLGLSVSPLLGPSSELQGAICLFTDLTAVVELEDQLRLKDSLARVGELTAGLAHEFRNGLATIHGYSRLLDPDALPAQFRPYIVGIRAETDAMREMVTNFLNFARPTQLMLAPVALRTIAERTAEDLHDDAAALGGEIRVAGEFATVDGDDVLLRQALSNLVRNAIESCQGAGAAPFVTIEAGIDPSRGLCTIAVSDNGPGFPPAARDRVFRPFYTTKPHGTGLGLALVQKIVVTHNGRVSATDAPSGGGLVTITLPLPHPAS